jgi:DNA-binding MarR family transcriptional regulator
MVDFRERHGITREELSNRLFFRLYQCANMVHKTGTRAVEEFGITTQQWAVLGALSRPAVTDGMSVNELAQFLLVSRQSLSGVISRLERDGLILRVRDDKDGRSRRVRLTKDGDALWADHVLPRIFAYYDRALDGFSVDDQVHALHYLSRLLDNLTAMDSNGPDDNGAAGETSG